MTVIKNCSNLLVCQLLFEGSIRCISLATMLKLNKFAAKFDQFCHCQEYTLPKSLATDAHTDILITEPMYPFTYVHWVTTCYLGLGNHNHNAIDHTQSIEITNQ